ERRRTPGPPGRWRSPGAALRMGDVEGTLRLTQRRALPGFRLNPQIPAPAGICRSNSCRKCEYRPDRRSDTMPASPTHTHRAGRNPGMSLFGHTRAGQEPRTSRSPLLWIALIALIAGLLVLAFAWLAGWIGRDRATAQAFTDSIEATGPPHP